MKQRNSRHFNIFYKPNSLAEKEIGFITVALEKSFAFIIKKLALSDNFPKINYYLYPDNNSKFRAMGDKGNANARIKQFAIHGIYNKKIKIVGRHEIVHLLTNKWGKSPELLRQGLAEAMEEKWHKINHHQWAKNFRKNKKLIALKDLLDDKKFWQFDDLITYPESGSFVKYLIDCCGLKLFKRLYKKLHYNLSAKQKEKIIKTIISKPLKELEKDWLDYVKIKNEI